MIEYPIQFRAHSEAASGRDRSWETTSAHVDGAAIKMAIPPEFEGPGGAYSPEDLYALSLANCYAATFKVMAQNSSLEYERLDVDVELTVDRDDHGNPWMSDADFTVRLIGPSNEDRAKRLLEKTRANCFILNSVKTRLRFEFEVRRSFLSKQ